MATPRSPSPRADAPLDSAPLLGGATGGGSRRRGGALRRPSLRGAARLLRRGGRRAMREPSVLVREAAAEHLEERQADWAYSRPVVALDLLWNLAFITVAAVVLVLRGTRTRPCRSGPGSLATPSSAPPRTGASSGSGRAPERARTGPSAADPATASFPRPRAAGSALRRRRGQIRPPGCGGEARRGGSGGGELAGRASGGGEAELPRF